ncbi:response regulator [Azospirillum thermophilum]|uniref:Response regulator n=1 Tax=Azospirillum thermophilum TaxID=2202148 RepID=A0A2S2CUZ8_9PROT|nr:response regulator [Azospirillum thermophilum]AWK88343.1 response regulator [Azospirillum thermophilum]
MISVTQAAGRDIPPVPAVEECAGPEGRRTRSLRVLVVEDEAIAAMDLEMMLEVLGHSVCGVLAEGPEAVREAGATRPDLVLMDIRLAGGTDGVEAAHDIRRLYGIRSLFLTAHNDRATLERAAAAQPFAVLTKPYSRNQLRLALDRAAQELDRA